MLPLSSEPQPSTAAATFHCPISGIRVRGGALTADQLKLVATGREACSVGTLAGRSPDLLAGKDVVVVGALASKSSTRESSKGNKFLVWTLSDLRGHKVSVTLFDTAYSFYKHDQPGGVFALISPTIVSSRTKDRASSSTPFLLSVTEEGQIRRIGTAAGFGHCPALQKDGRTCGDVVDTDQSRFCAFHAAEEYRRAMSKRPQFGQSSGSLLIGGKVVKSSLAEGGKSVSSGQDIMYDVESARTKARDGARSSQVVQQQPTVRTVFASRQPAQADTARRNPVVYRASGASASGMPMGRGSLMPSRSTSGHGVSASQLESMAEVNHHASAIHRARASGVDPRAAMARASSKSSPGEMLVFDGQGRSTLQSATTATRKRTDKTSLPHHGKEEFQSLMMSQKSAVDATGSKVLVASRSSRGALIAGRAAGFRVVHRTAEEYTDEVTSRAVSREQLRSEKIMRHNEAGEGECRGVAVAMRAKHRRVSEPHSLTGAPDSAKHRRVSEPHSLTGAPDSAKHRRVSEPHSLTGAADPALRRQLARASRGRVEEEDDVAELYPLPPSAPTRVEQSSSLSEVFSALDSQLRPSAQAPPPSQEQSKPSLGSSSHDHALSTEELAERVRQKRTRHLDGTTPSEKRVKLATPPMSLPHGMNPSPRATLARKISAGETSGKPDPDEYADRFLGASGTDGARARDLKRAKQAGSSSVLSSILAQVSTREGDLERVLHSDAYTPLQQSAPYRPAESVELHPTMTPGKLSSTNPTPVTEKSQSRSSVGLFEDAPLDAAQLQAAISSTSRYERAAEDEQWEHAAKTFGKMESLEGLSTVASTHTSAVRTLFLCRQCGSKFTKFPRLCEENGHTITPVKTTIFYRCCDKCGHRQGGEREATQVHKPCPSCGHRVWKPAPVRSLSFKNPHDTVREMDAMDVTGGPEIQSLRYG
jgi:hypothetical protein